MEISIVKEEEIMANDIFEYKSVSIKDAGYNEAWLQSAICDSPNRLGLGDLQLVAKEKIISSGGRLDILLQDTNDEKMYEVEVQLGDTDPSHIIRTIEYWDLIRKKYPLRQHYGVIIAETITRRFFNVIGLLSNSIPIIAIQCTIIEIDGKKALVFTKVLDAYEEPEDLQSEAEEKVDESYWVKLASRMLSVAKKMYQETKAIYQSTTLEYNKWSIVIKKSGYNEIKMKRRTGDFVAIEMKYGSNKEKIFEILDKSGVPTEDKYEQARFMISLEWIEQNIEVIKELAILNNDWWKSGDA